MCSPISDALAHAEASSSAWAPDKVIMQAHGDHQLPGLRGRSQGAMPVGRALPCSRWGSRRQLIEAEHLAARPQSRMCRAGIGSQLLVYELETASLRLTHSVFASAQHLHGFSLGPRTAAGHITLVVYGGRELQARSMWCYGDSNALAAMLLLTMSAGAGVADARGQSKPGRKHPAAAAAAVPLVPGRQLR